MVKSGNSWVDVWVNWVIIEKMYGKSGYSWEDWVNWGYVWVYWVIVEKLYGEIRRYMGKLGVEKI